MTVTCGRTGSGMMRPRLVRPVDVTPLLMLLVVVPPNGDSDGTDGGADCCTAPPGTHAPRLGFQMSPGWFANRYITSI